MRQLTKAAVLIAAAAVAAETFGDDYAAHTMWNCSDEGRGGRHPSPAAACAVTGAVAFRRMVVGGACIACDDDGIGPPAPPGTVIIIRPICPEGQHLNDAGECEADHECGDDEIGGGSEECQACGDGEVPNEDGTACRVCPDGEHEGQCDAFHEVARCERALDIPLAEYLPIPTHPNVLVENLALANSEIQRGFFPVNEDLAVDFAKIYVATIGAPGGPIVVYVDSKVERDADQGICEYEGEVLYEGDNPVVESPRHDTVKKRMLTTVHTRDPWHQYHALVRNSIKWADEVLR